MVSQDSARLWFPREQAIGCDADHSQIAKIKRGESGIYPDIKRAIRQAMLSVGDLYSEADDQYIVGSAIVAEDLAEDLVGMDINDKGGILDQEGGVIGHVEVVPGEAAEQLKEEEVGVDLEGLSAADETTEAMRTPGKDFGRQQSEPLKKRLDCPATDQPNSESVTPTNRDVSRSRSGLRDRGSPVAYTQESPSLLSKSARTSVDSVVHEDQEGLSRLSPANEKKCTSYERRLKTAIIRGDLKETHELLAKVYDINCTDGDGRTPLHDAAHWRAELIVEYLLRNGALSRAKTTSGDTSLHCIIEVKANMTPLTESLIDILLKYRPPLDEPDNKGVTPLMAAACKGELLMARKLINHGAHINKIDKTGNFALHHATGASNAPDMITLLIREGAETDSKGGKGWTPLHVAVSRPGDAVEAARCLLEAGANIEAETKYVGETSLHIAIWEGNFSTARLLLAHGANPLARSKRTIGGETVRQICKHTILYPDVKKTNKELLDMQNVLKEAEDAWKRSGKKYSRWRW